MRYSAQQSLEGGLSSASQTSVCIRLMWRVHWAPAQRFCVPEILLSNMLPDDVDASGPQATVDWRMGKSRRREGKVRDNGAS